MYIYKGVKNKYKPGVFKYHLQNTNSASNISCGRQNNETLRDTEIDVLTPLKSIQRELKTSDMCAGNPVKSTMY